MFSVSLTKQPSAQRSSSAFRIVVSVALLLIFSPFALCMTQQMKDAYNHASIAGSLNYLNYSEKNSFDENAPPTLISEKGFIPGIKMELMRTYNHLVIGADMSLHRGNDHHKDYYYAEDNQTILSDKSKTKNTLVGVNLHLGLLLNVTKNLTLEPFAQAGWRRWVVTLDTTKVDLGDNNFFNLGGYTEWYSHYTALAGLALTQQIAPTWVGKVSIAAGKTIDPKATSDIPVLIEGYPTNVRNKFKIGSRFEGVVNAQLNKRITNRTDLVLAISHRYFSYGQSSSIELPDGASITEPKSRTHETVATVGLQFGLGA